MGNENGWPMSVKDHFACYVINLDASTERWHRIDQHLQSICISAQRISAVYAADLPKQDILCHYKPELNQQQFFMPLKPAEIGCFMSHLKTLETFLNQCDKPYAVILEDDVEFVGDINQFYAQWLAAMQTDKPVMLKLYARRSVSGKVIYHHQGQSIIHPRLVPLGTQACVINRAAAQQLLQVWYQFGMPVDVAYQHYWQHGVKVLVTVPNHINEISAQVGGSNIVTKQKLPFIYKAKREIKRSWYRFILFIKSNYNYLLVSR